MLRDQPLAVSREPVSRRRPLAGARRRSPRARARRALRRGSMCSAVPPFPGRLIAGNGGNASRDERRVMPKKKSDLPGTLKRSPAKAQRTFMKAHDNAEEQYGDEERAHRTAFSALKHSFEKVGDHWEEKDAKGPSDPQAAKSGKAARRGGEIGR